MYLLSVIIPFYQKEAGILRKTVLSALNQTTSFYFEVIVVDDGSPVSARSEIGDLLNQYNNLKVIEQKNAGPGSARNRGIESVSDDSVYIAFLDSDDVWLDGHLENAVYALQLGYDFYFSDFYFADYKEKSAFERANKIQRIDHDCLDSSRDIYAYCGDMKDQILIKGNVIGTPTVVFNYKKYSSIRFREQFYNGQDYLFWLDFSETGGKIVLSFCKECDCGIGLNIYAGSGWGTENSLQRLCNEMFLWQSVATLYQLTFDQKKANNERLSNITESIIRDLMHRLVNKKTIKKEIILFLFAGGRLIRIDVIRLLFKILYKKTLNRY